MEKRNLDTICVQGGWQPKNGEPRVLPIYQSTTYKYDNSEQMGRLFKDKLFAAEPVTDDHGMIRMDDYEMRQDVQEEISIIWNKVTTENVAELADIEGYWEDFYKMFGFHIDGVDYEADVEV